MKTIRFMLCAMIFFALCIVSAYAEGVSVEIDGSILQTDAPAVNIDGRVLVPMRNIFEKLGAEVLWNNSDYSVTASADGEAVMLYINSDVMHFGIVNSDKAMIFSSEKKLDTYARLIGDYTFVPVRAVSEAFDAEVSWDGENEKVIIRTDDKSDDEYKIFYSSADDYGKIYSVNADGTNRRKLTDISAAEVFFDSGELYFIGYDGCLYNCGENGGDIVKLTDFDTKMLGFYNGRAYCVRTDTNVLYEAGEEITELGEAENAALNGGYVYYNRSGDTAMHILNLDTFARTSASMDTLITLSPYNCTFYGGYILLEDGSRYHNIYRFNADGSGKIYINNDNSRICKNQTEDENVLYINNDDGQNIYYVNINGSAYGRGKAVSLPDTVVYSDVLAQNGEFIYYKNMYRSEIYRTRSGSGEELYVGYGDTLNIFDNKLFITGDGVYAADLDGDNQYRICTRKLKDLFFFGSAVYGTDAEFGNIVSADYSGRESFITNDKILSQTNNIE